MLKFSFLKIPYLKFMPFATSENLWFKASNMGL